MVPNSVTGGTVKRKLIFREEWHLHKPFKHSRRWGGPKTGWCPAGVPLKHDPTQDFRSERAGGMSPLWISSIRGRPCGCV